MFSTTRVQHHDLKKCKQKHLVIKKRAKHLVCNPYSFGMDIINAYTFPQLQIPYNPVSANAANSLLDCMRSRCCKSGSGRSLNEDSVISYMTNGNKKPKEVRGMSIEDFLTKMEEEGDREEAKKLLEKFKGRPEKLPPKRG